MLNNEWKTRPQPWCAIWKY